MLKVIDSLQIQKENFIKYILKQGNHQFVLSMHKVEMRFICIQVAVYDSAKFNINDSGSHFMKFTFKNGC